MTRPLTDLLARAEWPDPAFDPDAVAGWPAGTIDHFLRLGLLAEGAPASAARCDACGADHVEPVQWVGGPGPDGRAFIPCPHEGLVRVPADSLRRWAVRLPALARALGETVGAAGESRECVPGRAWRLGSVRAAGRAWPAFLLTGLSLPDGAVVTAGVPELHATAVVAYVPSRVPPATVWAGGRLPAVVPLTDLLHLGPNGLRADPLVLESALTPAGRPTRPAPAAFPTPGGAAWEQVCLTVEDHHLGVRVGDTARRIGFAEAGFEDRQRTGVPDQTWELLKLFARRGGVVPTPSGVGTTPAALKTRVSKLRGRLRALVGIDGDPLPAARGGAYRARFAVRAAAGPVLPVPAGTAWGRTDIAEVEPGVVEIGMPVTTATVTPGPDGGSGGWKAAGVQSDRRHRFPVRDLGLSCHIIGKTF